MLVPCHVSAARRGVARGVPQCHGAAGASVIMARPRDGSILVFVTDISVTTKAPPGEYNKEGPAGLIHQVGIMMLSPIMTERELAEWCDGYFE